MANRPTPQKGHPFFRSLTFKVSFLAALITVVVLAIFSAVFIVTALRDERRSILENGKTFATFSADAVYDNYVQFYTHPQPEDFKNFRTRVTAMLESNRDIQAVSLIGLNGRILFDSREFNEGKYTGPIRTIDDDSTLEQIRSENVRTREVTQEGKTYTEITVPVLQSGGGHVMSARYLLAYESLGGRMSEVYSSTALVALSLLVFVLGAVAAISTRLVRPIVRLTHMAEQIRFGNFDAATGAGHTKDEVGRLGIAINEMAQQLKQSYQNLETKVRERTQELQAAQVKLLQNVKQDEALLSSIGDGVIATDQSSHIIWMNKAAEDMLKITRQESLSKLSNTVWRLETEMGEQVTEAELPTRQAYDTGKTARNSNYYYVRRDQANAVVVRFPVAITAAPVMLNDQVIGIINIFRDITHEKQVDRMKTEFISLASHQLRTPLSAIKWFTEMLMNGDAGKLNDEQAEFARNVWDSTERMIELVNSLLNISRIESGRIIIDPKPTDLNELVSGIVNDLKAKTEEKQQTLIVSVHKDLGKINLDPRLIGQVYMNFLTNAIKYTPKGGEVSVFISRKGDEVVSQITDNGYGIPAAGQSKIFQKFFRADNVAKIETDGTGLGLYLVKAIIESSGGKVWFESQEGKGTTFWFSLPMTGMRAKEGEVTLDV